MPKTLQKYLSKIKKPPSPPPIHLPSSLSASASWIMKKRNHHSKTLPLDPNPVESQCKDIDAATLADVDRFLFDNFKSLYFKEDEEGPKKEDGDEKTFGHVSRPPYVGPPRDLCGPHRSFVGPSSLSSLMEEARSSTTTSGDTGSCSSTTFTNTASTTTTTTTTTDFDDEAAGEAMGPEDFIALFTYSPSPYEDFRASMNEMIGARLKHHEKVDWEFMEELLFCYMNLNDRKWSKYILRAFIDIVVDLRERSCEVPVKSQQVR